MMQLILSTIKQAVRIMLCRVRYWLIERRIRAKAKSGKVKVLFLNSEPSKWKCQSVYEAMEKSGIFEPIIGITALGEQSTYRDEELITFFKVSEDFFDTLGDRHVRTVSFNPRRYCDLKQFEPDIVFYPEPWNAQWPQTVAQIAHYSLACYVSYFVEPCINSKEHIHMHCLMDMHKFLYAYFIQSKELKDIFRSELTYFNHSYNMVVSGHPSLDSTVICLSDCGASRKIVVYAPHFSVQPVKGGGSKYLRSTFDSFGEVILKYAHEHPEIQWVFKPHPKLRRYLAEAEVWPLEKVEQYFSEWESFAICCYDGNYGKLFKESSAMITDSSSFLLEYGLLGKPVIHLVPKIEVSCYLPSVKVLIDGYYKVQSIDDLMSVLNKVLIGDDDYLKEERLAALEKMDWAHVNAAKNIVDYFCTRLKIHKLDNPLK